jgi:hypothetical protein
MTPPRAVFGWSGRCRAPGRSLGIGRFRNPLALVPLVPGQAPAVLAAPRWGPLTPWLGATMTDLKHRLVAILASPRGKALIEAGQTFSMEELQAACAEVLAEAESSDEKAVIEATLKALIARKAN